MLVIKQNFTLQLYVLLLDIGIFALVYLKLKK